MAGGSAGGGIFGSGSRPLGGKLEAEPTLRRRQWFGNAIADYRRNIIRRYSTLADEQGFTRDPAKWFADHRREIELAGLNPFAQAASATVLAQYERAPSCVEALGALNRWPRRTFVPIEDYFRQWQASCAELEASPLLPTRLGEMLGIA